MRNFVFLWFAMMSYSLQAAQMDLHPKAGVLYSGAEVTIKLTSEAGEVKDGSWLGVFDGNGKYHNYVYWKPELLNYTLKLPNQSGEYEIRLATNHSGSEYLAKTPAFKVAVADANQVALQLDSLQVKPLQAIKVSLKSQVPLSAQGWIGIFKEDLPHNTHSGYATYSYLQGKTEFKFTAPEVSGAYEFRLFDDAYGNEIAVVEFQVKPLSDINASLAIEQASFKPGDTIAIDYKGHKDFAKSAWVGIFDLTKVRSEDPHQGYITFQYLPSPLAGQVVFVAPEKKGQYELRLFTSNYGDWVATQPFVVSESLDADYVEQQIDAQGKVSLYGIYFDHDKSEIQSVSEPTLKALADFLKKKPELAIEVQGHTDNTGASGYNQTLSEQRADAVVSYLHAHHGIALDRLVAKGLGDKQPVATNDTVDGRARNRRVDVLPVQR